MLRPFSLGSCQEARLGKQIIRREGHGLGGAQHRLIAPGVVGARDKCILMTHRLPDVTNGHIGMDRRHRVADIPHIRAA